MTSTTIALGDYRAEFATVRRSLDRSARELSTMLTSLGLHRDAVQVGEAIAFLDGALRSIDRTLAGLVARER